MTELWSREAIYSMADHLMAAPSHEPYQSVGEQLRALYDEVVRLRRFEKMYQEATAIQGDEEVLLYVTSGNAIPVTRCTVSADLIRQLVEARRLPPQVSPVRNEP